MRKCSYVFPLSRMIFIFPLSLSVLPGRHLPDEPSTVVSPCAIPFPQKCVFSVCRLIVSKPKTASISVTLLLPGVSFALANGQLTVLMHNISPLA